MGQSIAYMSLEISLLSTFDTGKRFPVLLFCLCVQALEIKGECGGVVTIRGFRGFTCRSLKMIFNVGHEGQVTEVPPLTFYLNKQQWGDT